MTTFQSVVTVPTGTNPTYYLNVGNSGLFIRNGANNLVHVATAGTLTANYNMSGTCNCTYCVVGNSITTGASTSSATVTVTGSRAFSQDVPAKSTKLTRAQLPITNTLDVTGTCTISGALTASGGMTASNKSRSHEWNQITNKNNK